MTTAAVDTSTMTPLLSVRDLCHSYDDRVVLSGLTLDVQPGEVVGILGRNGSGKSTAIAVVAGLMPRQSGTIEVDGHAVRTFERGLRADMGVVFQSPALDDRLSCMENLQFAAALHALPRSVAKPRIQEQMAAAGLADRSKDLVATLSGGMKRRLDLARALLHRPRFLLMDEPTSGLDEAAFRTTWDRLNEMRGSSGTAILLATHRADEAERCDRIAILDGGQIVETDTPSALRARVLDDLIVLSGEQPEAMAEQVQKTLGLTCQRSGSQVFVECERGHEVVPKLVCELDPQTLSAVELRRPSLADVFLKITGHSLSEQDGEAA